jgi:hypothetical protein
VKDAVGPFPASCLMRQPSMPSQRGFAGRECRNSIWRDHKFEIISLLLPRERLQCSLSCSRTASPRDVFPKTIAACESNKHNNKKVGTRRPPQNATAHFCTLPDGAEIILWSMRRRPSPRTSAPPIDRRIALGLRLAIFRQNHATVAPVPLSPKTECRGFSACCARLSFTHESAGRAKYSGYGVWATPARDCYRGRAHRGAVRGCGDRAALAAVAWPTSRPCSDCGGPPAAVRQFLRPANCSSRHLTQRLSKKLLKVSCRDALKRVTSRVVDGHAHSPDLPGVLSPTPEPPRAPSKAEDFTAGSALASHFKER